MPPTHPRMCAVQEKVCYKESFNQLRELKKEIEHLQMLLEQSRQRLQKDFLQWLGLMSRQGLVPGQGAGPVVAGEEASSFQAASPSASSSSASVLRSPQLMSVAGGGSPSRCVRW